MLTTAEPRPARRIADILRHSWRDGVDSNLNPDEVSDLIPLILGSGLAPLVQRHLRAPHPQLQDATRLSVLHSAVRADRVQRVVETFRAHGIEPLIGKGWSVATRFYRDPALRPSSDIDLFVAAKDYGAAIQIGRRRATGLTAVDLHCQCEELSDRPWRSIVEKRIELRANETTVSVFSDEQHLRLLTLHFAKHAGFRALWLCDVAALVERQRATLDWDEILRGKRWRSSWVLGVVALARDLLGADVSGTPAERLRLPRWAAPAVLHEWETPFRWPAGRPPALAAISSGGVVSAARELRARWPSPIEASFYFGGALNGVPRLPYELLQCMRQGLAIPRQFFQWLGRQAHAQS
ncbi:MAG TPA: nucleotidyltransferase family protein [Vicinamibacterales bacterium]